MQPDVLPPIEVEIGGRRRRLRWGFRALRAIEMQLPGVNALKGLGAFLDECDATRQAVFVWAGLLHAEPKLELDTVIDWLDADFAALPRTWEALAAATPTPEGGQPENPPSAPIG